MTNKDTVDVHNDNDNDNQLFATAAAAVAKSDSRKPATQQASQTFEFSDDDDDDDGDGEEQRARSNPKTASRPPQRDKRRPRRHSNADIFFVAAEMPDGSDEQRRRQTSQQPAQISSIIDSSPSPSTSTNPNSTTTTHSAGNVKVGIVHGAAANGRRQLWPQQHSPQMQRLDAVIIRNLSYEVGRGSKRKAILNKINLTVPEASIYGLLGPSGCGKTTMLRCVVGRIRSKAGNVLVFGQAPNSAGGQIPGRAVGYMPQEISIYDDFTIEETLQYFGRINRLSAACIRQRIDFLLEFLDLPTQSRLVTNLSGGQKRRVSLAAALVHSPPLLILDEPTVGVDPLLRQSIWRHLVTLTQSESISVIITTHYIEEARQANVVGLMRHGKILAEASPSSLMAEHKLPSLEDVFLKLCVTDSARKAAVLATLPTSTSTPTFGDLNGLKNSKGRQRRRRRQTQRDFDDDDHDHDHDDDDDQRKEPQTASYDNAAVQALSSDADDSDDFWRAGAPARTLKVDAGQQRQQSGADDDYLGRQVLGWAGRRTSDLLLGPASANGQRKPRKAAKPASAPKSSAAKDWLETLMAVTWKNYIRLRRNPPVLVFQFMLPAIQVILFCLCIGGEPFDVPLAVVNDEARPQSSVQFLNGLDSKVIRQIKFDNLSAALEAVRRGQVWGALHIPDKYSQSLQSRLIAGDEATNETIRASTIRVYPDLTNLHLAIALETTFRNTFVQFARDSLDQLGYDRALADMPIQIAKPVYGSLKKDGYLEFMAPGVVISISYVMATGLTALAFILERRDGLLERSLVSGVQTSQILLAHAINQVVVMIIQIFMVLGCVFFVFEIPSRGPFVWVVLLILLQGCTGMGFGLLVSAVCSEENTAVMMLVGTFYTNLILAGIIWPIEAMPHWLRPLSYAQPQTLPTDTLRHILSRGWGITDASVLLGFGVTIGWLAVFLITAGLIFKYSG